MGVRRRRSQEATTSERSVMHLSSWRRCLAEMGARSSSSVMTWQEVG